VTVPVDNPVRLRMRSYGGGSTTWNLSRVSAGIESGSGDVINSGVGGNVSAGLWGPNEVNAVNGRSDYVYCYYHDTYPQKLRLDPFDEVRHCGGDIVPPPTGTEPPPPPPDPDSTLELGSQKLADVRDCIEQNVSAPGSCTGP
jgi:hypothetical protein